MYVFAIYVIKYIFIRIPRVYSHMSAQASSVKDMKKRGKNYSRVRKHKQDIDLSYSPD